jgi:hypothetical protein
VGGKVGAWGPLCDPVGFFNETLAHDLRDASEFWQKKEKQRICNEQQAAMALG